MDLFITLIFFLPFVLVSSEVFKNAGKSYGVTIWKINGNSVKNTHYHFPIVNIKKSFHLSIVDFTGSTTANVGTKDL